MIVAVDGGLAHCRKMEIVPDLIIGDMDSCSFDTLQKYAHIETLVFPKNKDKTDLEIALEHVCHENIEKIKIYAGLGKRIDHSIGNILLLSRYPSKVFLETESELLFVVKDRIKINSYKGQTISLIPLNGKVEGINSKGLKWELKEAQMDKYFMGISNECLCDILSLSIKKGDLLCCIKKISTA